MTRPFTKDRIENIRKAYINLKSMHKVSRVLSVSKSTAYKYAGNLAPHQNIITSLCSDDQRLLGTYIGLWLGDGTQYYDDNFTIKICTNKNNILLNQLIQDILLNLFGKSSSLAKSSNHSSAYIKFHSKFIYDFIYEYVEYEGRKAHSVRLKKNLDKYGNKFLEGCFLGLMLSDGYLKHTLSFNVTSVRLANNMKDILLKFGFDPYISITRREKFGWKDLHCVRLRVQDSKLAELFLDGVLHNLGFKYSFKELKYEYLVKK